jgi:hypothetical protein
MSKTDMNDAMWIADPVACGPLGAGFVPAERLQELRSLMHARKQVSREETRHVHPNESAGKRKPVRLRHGSPWPKTILVQCAWAAKRKKERYYRAQFRSSAGR